MIHANWAEEVGFITNPRLLLDEYTEVIPIKNEKEASLCCGGSLGNIKIQMKERDQISNKAMDEYLSYQPDMLATACPLCKKTFAKNRNLPVHDISEIVYMAIEEYTKIAKSVSKAECQKRKK